MLETVGAFLVMKEGIITPKLRQETRRNGRSNECRPHPEELCEAMHLEGWQQGMESQPSFETPREERGSSP
jgi:hypothetical protein